MSYVVCYIAAVPEDQKDTYMKHCATAAAVFKDHGATRVVECWGDEVPDGKLTSLPMAVKAEPGEVVVMGWQEWPDKETHVANREKAMQDPRMQVMMNMPIDGKRMIYGGFEQILEL